MPSFLSDALIIPDFPLPSWLKDPKPKLQTETQADWECILSNLMPHFTKQYAGFLTKEEVDAAGTAWKTAGTLFPGIQRGTSPDLLRDGGEHAGRRHDNLWTRSS